MPQARLDGSGQSAQRDICAVRRPIRRSLFGSLAGRQACAAGWASADPWRASTARRRQPTAGRERWKPERGETPSGGSMPRTTARPGYAGRRKEISTRKSSWPMRSIKLHRRNVLASDGEHLQPSSARVTIAAARPDETDGRAAARHGRPAALPSVSRGHCAPSLIQSVKP
jgi:hypothetical protein